MNNNLWFNICIHNLMGSAGSHEETENVQQEQNRQNNELENPAPPQNNNNIPQSEGSERNPGEFEGGTSNEATNSNGNESNSLHQRPLPPSSLPIMNPNRVEDGNRLLHSSSMSNIAAVGRISPNITTSSSNPNNVGTPSLARNQLAISNRALTTVENNSLHENQSSRSNSLSPSPIHPTSHSTPSNMIVQYSEPLPPGWEVLI